VPSLPKSGQVVVRCVINCFTEHYREGTERHREKRDFLDSFKNNMSIGKNQ